jgi:hypothetical protein
MQDEQEDNLSDYNDDPQYAGSRTNAQPPSHTPVQTPPNLNSKSEGDEEDGNDLEEGQEPEEDIRSAELAQREQIHKEFEALSLRLSENGWKMRMKVWVDPDQAFKPMPMTAPTKTLAEVLQTVPLEDAVQISEFQGLGAPATKNVPFFLKIRKLYFGRV